MNIGPQIENSQINMQLTGGNSGAPSSGADFSFKDFMQGTPNAAGALGVQSLISAGDFNIDEILKDVDFAFSAKWDTKKIEEKDAIFFLNLLDQNRAATGFSLQGAGVQNLLGAAAPQEAQGASAVSKTLLDMLHKANQANKPIRLDFDNNITLVMRVDASGKINAQFFPGDSAAQEYLKNNIPFLRQRFDEQNIPYSSLEYKNRNQKNKEKNK